MVENFDELLQIHQIKFVNIFPVKFLHRSYDIKNFEFEIFHGIKFLSYTTIHSTIHKTVIHMHALIN